MNLLNLAAQEAAPKQTDTYYIQWCIDQLHSAWDFLVGTFIAFLELAWAFISHPWTIIIASSLFLLFVYAAAAGGGGTQGNS